MFLFFLKKRHCLNRVVDDDDFRGAAYLEGTLLGRVAYLDGSASACRCLESTTSAGSLNYDGFRGTAYLEGTLLGRAAYLGGSASVRRLPRRHYLGRAARGAAC